MFKFLTSQKIGMDPTADERRLIEIFMAEHGLNPRFHQFNSTTIGTPLNTLMRVDCAPCDEGPLVWVQNTFTLKTDKTPSGKLLNLIGVFMHSAALDGLNDLDKKEPKGISDIRTAVAAHDDIIEHGFIPVTNSHPSMRRPIAAWFATPLTLYSIPEETREKLLAVKVAHAI